MQGAHAAGTDADQQPLAIGVEQQHPFASAERHALDTAQAPSAGRGEVVVINEKFGIRLTDVISPAERVRKLR